jgi:hypothetical protein
MISIYTPIDGTSSNICDIAYIRAKMVLSFSFLALDLTLDKSQ